MDLYIGVKNSQRYISKKWGMDTSKKSGKVAKGMDCKSIKGIIYMSFICYFYRYLCAHALLAGLYSCMGNKF
jgi:hypothetical protein